MTSNLNHYLEAWNLSEPQLLAQTATSHVYTVTSEGTHVILKLMTAIGDEEGKGAAALRYFDGYGAVRLLRADDQAHLLEYADGENLIPMVERGEDEKATAIIGDVLNTLHAPCDRPFPGELTPLRTWFRSLFNGAETDRRKGFQSIYVRAAPVADALLSEPQNVHVLHGDVHHENIRHSARGWLAFDPKGLIGERTFDAANTLCNPINMSALVENEQRLLTNAAILAQKINVTLSRLLRFTFAYACLSARWILDDGDNPMHALKIAELVEPHIQREITL